MMRQASKLLFAVSLVTALILIFAAPVFCQRTTGTLRGQVLDTAGATVANAKVTATNEETGVSVSIMTTSAGTYDFPSILPGRYKVTAEVSGFKKAVKSDVVTIISPIFQREHDAQINADYTLVPMAQLEVIP